MDPMTEDATPPPRRRLSRRASLLGAIIALAALAGLGWLAWDLTHPATATTAAGGPGAGGRGGGRAGPGGGAPPTTVGTAVAERTDVPVVLEALGTVTASTVTVRPQVSGVLKDVLYHEGQMVNAGQLLATIDPRQFEMAVQQASGQRLRDEAQLDAARVTLQRFQTLLAQDSIARQDVDTQAALVKQLEGSVITDRANEGTARLNLSYTRITSPISGRVGLRVVDPGNLVSSGDANGIVVITRLSPIDVEFAIPQDRVAEVQARASKGAQLPVTALDRTRTDVLETGTFLTLDNVVDTQTGTVRAKARFSNTKHTLFPAQFVNVRLLLRTIEGAVAVPVTAVRHGTNGEYVYVLDVPSRTVAMRPVTRGQATADKVIITSGLKVGETVVTEGADRLKDGSRVVLQGDQPAAPGAGRPAGGRRGQGNAAGIPEGQAGSPPAEGQRRFRNRQGAPTGPDAAPEAGATPPRPRQQGGGAPPPQ
ncbi:MAG TPA: efflux RND transporter periplasmic adaptor subunit [Casimicrobiaceae bacterium]|nr:efflux RND transporter periplasmic adaptor subunit [Casimicrobiaceae bacterium]